MKRNITISKAPLITPMRMLEYQRLLCPSGSSTNSANGLFSITSENSSPAAFHPTTCGEIPRNVLNPCYGRKKISRPIWKNKLQICNFCKKAIKVVLVYPRLYMMQIDSVKFNSEFKSPTTCWLFVFSCDSLMYQYK